MNTNELESTISTVAPIAAAGVANPEVALALRLAPAAIQLLQSAQTIAEAGALNPQQLADLWLQIGQGIQAAHTAWIDATTKGS